MCKGQNLPSSTRSRVSCCSRLNLLSSSRQAYSKHSSSPPSSLRDIAEVTAKPTHRPKGLLLGEILASCLEEPLGSRPQGHTLSPGQGLGQALAVQEWRVYTGSWAQRRAGQARKGVAPLSREEGQGKVGQNTCPNGNAPPSPDPGVLFSEGRREGRC